jgi:hypothetical protein
VFLGALSQGLHCWQDPARARCKHGLESTPGPRPPVAPAYCRDEIEELCSAALKEAQIEVKLQALRIAWADEVFTFAEHKLRGLVVLKVRGWGCLL